MTYMLIIPASDLHSTALSIGNYYDSTYSQYERSHFSIRAIDKSWEDEDASDEVNADVQFEETNRASCERDPGPGELRRRAQTERNDRTAKVNFICY